MISDRERERRRRERAVVSEYPRADPYSGRYRKVKALLREDKRGLRALREADRWRREAPGDVLALLALGEALQATGNTTDAARAYGSIIDLYPSRADMRRMAGEHLDTLAPVGQTLALDSYRQAYEQRSDHPSSHRLYAYALLKVSKASEALSVLHGAYQRFRYSGARGVARMLKDDLAIAYAVLEKQGAAPEKNVLMSLRGMGIEPARRASHRFVLYWESDANDVDLHIFDKKRYHASFAKTWMPSGGELYGDVTRGYGPESFVISSKPRAFPYRLFVHYYNRGPMGYGMGKVQSLYHDGKGNLGVEDRAFVVMKDKAFVDLGEYRSLPTSKLAMGPQGS